MKEKRKVLGITVTSVSAIEVLRNKYSRFYVTGGDGNVWMCAKKALYDAFSVGEDIKIIVSRTHQIVGVVGFVIPEEEIIEDYTILETPPANHCELELYDKLTAEGWDVTKRGWADFACFKNGEFIAIEVKPKRSHRLKTRQSQVMEAMASYGIKCYRWSPDEGFTQIHAKQNTI